MEKDLQTVDLEDKRVSHVDVDADAALEYLTHEDTR
jgi:hypothetical protein